MLYCYIGDENKEKLLELGVLDYLLGLMTHEDKVIKRNTAMCIGTMATNCKDLFTLFEREIFMDSMHILSGFHL